MTSAANLNALKLAKAVNAFADDLYPRCISSGEDSFVSPLSVALALLLLANGSQGKTLEELVSILKLQELQPLPTANVEVRELLQSLHSLPTTSTFVRIANSVWIRPGFKIQPNYHAVVANHYDATVHPLTSIDEVNKWCASKTEGKIKDILPPNPPVEDYDVCLVNAVYFKGLWKEPFKKELTRAAPFYLHGGTQRQCHLMQLSLQKYDDFGYVETQALEAIRLPYKSNPGEYALDAVIVLPKTSAGDTVEWAPLWGQLSSAAGGGRGVLAERRGGRLLMPRFKVEAKHYLLEHLKALGLQTVAELQPLLGELTEITAVLHKVVVEADEEGTVAAAVTAIVGYAGGLPAPGPPPFEMRCDRPFKFYIVARETGLRIFAGQVCDPGLVGDPPAAADPSAQRATRDGYRGFIYNSSSAPFPPSHFPSSPATAVSSLFPPHFPTSPSTAVSSLFPPHFTTSPSTAVSTLFPPSPFSTSPSTIDAIAPTIFPPPSLHPPPPAVSTSLERQLSRGLPANFLDKLGLAATADPQQASLTTHAHALELLIEASKMIKAPLTAEYAKSARAAETLLNTAFHAFRVANDLSAQSCGTPLPTGLYNMACVLSLAVELQLKLIYLREARASVPPGGEVPPIDGPGLLSLLQSRGAMPILEPELMEGPGCVMMEVKIGQLLPPAPVPLDQSPMNLGVLAQKRIEACRTLLRLAAAMPGAGTLEPEKDEDLFAAISLIPSLPE